MWNSFGWNLGRGLLESGGFGVFGGLGEFEECGEQGAGELRAAGARETQWIWPLEWPLSPDGNQVYTFLKQGVVTRWNSSCDVLEVSRQQQYKHSTSVAPPKHSPEKQEFQKQHGPDEQKDRRLIGPDYRQVSNFLGQICHSLSLEMMINQWTKLYVGILARNKDGNPKRNFYYKSLKGVAIKSLKCQFEANSNSYYHVAKTEANFWY
ncbi:uncharacterized protein [Emydura macquarii macquarii]|uniref:uncharacterized protein n=1 Tax=Emydura macquarii macquarii TaxID=1129001 RepID=UPI00352A48B4